ncbi:hypothetical protein AGMMS50225_06250 [Betaproteobacteria bacterium]|nr:hypothetical protein AGMMS50225_06250 [Betaproteobacteria bacterium]
MAEPGDQLRIDPIGLGAYPTRLPERFDLCGIDDADPVSGIHQELGNRFPVDAGGFQLDRRKAQSSLALATSIPRCNDVLMKTAPRMIYLVNAGDRMRATGTAGPKILSDPGSEDE